MLVKEPVEVVEKVPPVEVEVRLTWVVPLEV